jgi:hypothetical protein
MTMRPWIIAKALQFLGYDNASLDNRESATVPGTVALQMKILRSSESSESVSLVMQRHIP